MMKGEMNFNRKNTGNTTANAENIYVTQQNSSFWLIFALVSGWALLIPSPISWWSHRKEVKHYKELMASLESKLAERST